jgi:lysophospholipase L1-like esterase
VELARGRPALIARVASVIGAALALLGCGITAPTSSSETTSVRYLALGDSYTIGTGASGRAHNYPSILAARITKATGRKVGVTNPAVNGFTTLDLIAKELGYVGQLKPDLVSILIGVNDLVQGRTPEQYQSSLVQIYDIVAGLKLPAGRVVAISIPNWSVVPAARTFGEPNRIRALTDSFNAIAQREAQARGFTWTDITAASTSGLGSPRWISSDALHPGDAQYAAWAEVIWSAVREPWTLVGSKP